MRALFLFVIAAVVVCFGVPAELLPASEPVTGAMCDVGGAGFLLGLAHGFLMLLTAIASIFFDIGIYESCNTGGWYNFGFVLGIIFYFGGSTSSSDD